MAINIRANVNCSLGELISASIGDSGIGTSGLVTVSGSCVIDGIVSPAPGTIVTFTYTKDGQSYTIPRKLRVLSSYSDPYRRITQVNLGCKLTYLADLQEYESLESLNDPNNSSYSESDAEVITLPIYASSILDICATRLGITIGPGASLTNAFSIARFDFTEPYVNIISDLLVSESRCGYLDYNEVLQIFSLNDTSGTGPVLASENVIDIAPLGATVPPADNVIVSYSSLKLKQPEQPDPSSDGLILSANIYGDGGNYYTNDNWTKDISIGPDTEYRINYIDLVGQESIIIFQGKSTTTTTTSYKKIKVIKDKDKYGRKIYEQLEVVDTRETVTKEPFAKYGSKYLSAQFTFGNLAISGVEIRESERTVVTFYYDEYGNETSTVTEKYLPIDYIVYSTDLPIYFAYNATTASFVPYPTTSVLVERTVVNSYKQERRSKTVTATYAAWYTTREGQQSIADSASTFTNVSQVLTYIATVFTLTYIGQSVNISEVSPGRAIAQAKPAQADLINAKYSDGDGSADDGWRTQSETDYSIAVNGSISGKRIVLSLPYAPDDTFRKVGSSYSSIASDAPSKALNYGKSQSKLLIGACYGIQLQTAPEILPSSPFSPVILQANGLSALYRIDSLSWSISASGVVCSFSGLFYGAIAGTGDFWFPVAEGITTLPETPPIVDGQMTVTSTVPVGNEIIRLQSRVKTSLTVISYNFPLLLTTQASISIKTELTASSTGPVTIINIITAPAVVLSVLTPILSASAVISAPNTSISLGFAAPTIRASVGDVYPETAYINVSAPVPVTSAYTGRIDINVTPQVALTVNTPILRVGSPNVKPPVVSVSLSTNAPAVAISASALISNAIEVLTSIHAPLVSIPILIKPDSLAISLYAGLTVSKLYHPVYEDIATDWSYVTTLTNDVVPIGILSTFITVACGKSLAIPTANIGLNVTGVPVVEEDNYIVHEIFGELPIVANYDTYTLKYGETVPSIIPAPEIVTYYYYKDYIMQTYYYEVDIYRDWWGS